MAIKLKMKKGDRVIVIAGKDKGKQGEILRMLPTENRAVVQGINMVTKHKKPTGQADGEIVRQEAAIHVSNLAHIDPADGKPVRVGYRVTEDGRKVRFAKRSGTALDQ